MRCFYFPQCTIAPSDYAASSSALASNITTLDQCAQMCVANRYYFFAVSMIYCLAMTDYNYNPSASNSKYPENCNSPCPGITLESCGGVQNTGQVNYFWVVYQRG